MISLGIILLVLGFVFKISILWSIGIVLLVIGAGLMVLGSLGHAVGGRSHYYRPPAPTATRQCHLPGFRRAMVDHRMMAGSAAAPTVIDEGNNVPASRVVPHGPCARNSMIAGGP